VRQHACIHDCQGKRSI
jgi:hypothetical protein